MICDGGGVGVEVEGAGSCGGGVAAELGFESERGEEVGEGVAMVFECKNGNGGKEQWLLLL